MNTARNEILQNSPVEELQKEGNNSRKMAVVALIVSVAALALVVYVADRIGFFDRRSQAMAGREWKNKKLTPAPGPTVQPTSAPDQANFIFGPFHLPSNEFDGDFTGAFLGLRADTAISTLEAVRAAGGSVVVNLSGGRNNFQKTDGAFDAGLWKNQVNRFAGIDLNPYIADGTVVGHMMMDEPHDPSNWNGAAVPCADLEAAAAYSKSLWPNLAAGPGTPATWLADQPCDWQALDLAYAQYTAGRRQPIAEYINSNVRAAAAAGVKLFMGINVLGGGQDRGWVAAADLLEWGSAMIAEPKACSVLMWKWDEGYFGSADVQEAVEQLGAQAAGRSGC